MVGFELEVLAKKLDRFGWDRDRGTPAHDRLLTDWMDVLQEYPLDEVQRACAAAVLSNSNKVPNEGHVRAEILKARKRAMSARPVMDRTPAKTTPRDQINPERKAEADAIMAGVFPSKRKER